MSAYTPGPWNVSQPCELSPRYSVYHNGPLVYVERGEDARLIAAAPDLLVALQDLLSATEETYDNRHEREAALDAIIKATGGAA